MLSFFSCLLSWECISTHSSNIVTQESQAILILLPFSAVFLHSLNVLLVKNGTKCRPMQQDQYPRLMFALVFGVLLIFKNMVNENEILNSLGLMGCGTQLSYLFFILFQIFFSLIMLNLFVAVIIEGF